MSVNNTALGGTQPVSGTVAVSSVSGTVAVSGSVTVSGTVAATQSGTWNIGTVTTLTSITNAVTVTGTVAATQSGTWTARITGNAGATLDSTIGAATAPTNAIATSNVYQSTVPVLTAGQAVAMQCDTAGSLYVNVEGRKQTYVAGFRGYTPVVSAASPMILFTGSGTKTCRITKIRYSSTAATGGVADLSLQRFSVISTGTVNATATAGLNDTTNAAATATLKQYSTIPGTATAAGGMLRVERYETITATVTVPVPLIEWDFGNQNEQALVVRGTSDFIGLLISAVGTTPIADVWVEWTEE